MVEQITIRINHQDRELRENRSQNDLRKETRHNEGTRNHHSLVVIGFDDEHTAFEMRAELVKHQKECLGF